MPSDTIVSVTVTGGSNTISFVPAFSAGAFASAACTLATQASKAVAIAKTKNFLNIIVSLKRLCIEHCRKHFPHPAMDIPKKIHFVSVLDLLFYLTIKISEFQYFDHFNREILFIFSIIK